MSPIPLTKRINDFVTAEQAAAILGISVATLWRWKAQGQIVGMPLLGRTVFSRAKIESLRKRRLSAAG